MVVDTPSEEQIDRVFRALSDRTRRSILRDAIDGSLSVSALARRHPMSTAAVQKHVAVLVDAGLVTSTRVGRETRVQTDIATLATAQALLDQLDALWRSRMAGINTLLTSESEDTP